VHAFRNRGKPGHGVGETELFYYAILYYLSH